MSSVSAGDPLALLRLPDEVQRAHVVQPVGQLHQQNAHVLGDGQDEAAAGSPRTDVLRLSLQLQPGQLGDALHQLGDLGPEQAGDVVGGGPGVLDNVMQQRGDDGCGVEPVFGQDARTRSGGRSRDRRTRAAAPRACAWRTRRPG
jgi:hypothetical protein